jgi:hypothetical protein
MAAASLLHTESSRTDTISLIVPQHAADKSNFEERIRMRQVTHSIPFDRAWRQSVDDEDDEEEKKPKLTAEQKAAKAELQKQQESLRALHRNKARSRY